MTMDMKHYFFTISMTYTLVLLLANLPSIKTEPRPATLSAKLFYVSSVISQMFLYAIVLTSVTLFIREVIANTTAAILISAIVFTIGWMLILANSKVYSRYRFNINTTILGLLLHKGASEVVQPTVKEAIYFAGSLILMIIIACGLEYLGW